MYKSTTKSTGLLFLSNAVAELDNRGWLRSNSVIIESSRINVETPTAASSATIAPVRASSPNLRPCSFREIFCWSSYGSSKSPNPERDVRDTMAAMDPGGVVRYSLRRARRLSTWTKRPMVLMTNIVIANPCAGNGLV